MFLGTLYRYDGQMGFEDVNGQARTVTDYALGGRGVDGISVTKNHNAAVLSYPLYDAHGNMVMTISRAGTNNFSPSSERSFDAWGNIRMGATTGDPSGRYCASLGHKQDDESGLIYPVSLRSTGSPTPSDMRARYYEPTSGRFISEDSSLAGRNWFVYSLNNPNSNGDYSGNISIDLLKGILVFVLGLFMAGVELGSIKTEQISDLVRYIGQWSDVFDTKGLSAESMAEMSSEVVAQVEELQQLQRPQRGARIRAGMNGLVALMGLSLIYRALIMDIDNQDGPDILGTVYGG